MELGRGVSLLSCFLLAIMFSQSFPTPVLSRSILELNDQKNFFHFPKHSDAKPGGDCPTPSHGGGSSPSKPTPTPSPSKPTPTPSHGGGGSPVKPTPSPSKPTPTPSHGGGSTPSSPSKPTPSHGGGGGGYYNSPPPAPIIVPPVAPVTPTPPKPSSPEPHMPPSFPGTCDYWSSHPDAILSILGYWGSIAQSFGAACSSTFGKNLSLHDALKNTRADGIGALYRQGTAAFLNSVACRDFPYSSQQVKNAFATAIVSNEAATSQAQLFKLANEGKTKL